MGYLLIWSTQAAFFSDKAGKNVGSHRLVMPSYGTTLEGIAGAAVGTQRLPRILDRQVHARMRVPELHGRHGAVQGQVIRSNFYLPLFIVAGVILHGLLRQT